MDLLQGVTQGPILGHLLILLHINDLPSSCEFLNSISFSDDTNPKSSQNQHAFFLLNKFSEINPKLSSASELALNIDKTQAITFLKEIGGKTFVYQIPSWNEIFVKIILSFL